MSESKIRRRHELELWEMVKSGEIVVSYPNGSRKPTFRVRSDKSDRGGGKRDTSRGSARYS